MSVFSLASFSAHLHAIERDVDNVPQRIIEFAARVLEAEAKSAIGTDRYGWPPLAELTLEKKGSGDTPLLETGGFRESISHTIGHHEAWVGSADQRAPWFEYGTSRMPPRPVFGPAVEARRADIVKAARAMLAAAMAGRGHNANELRELLHLLRELGHFAKELWDAVSSGEDRR